MKSEERGSSFPYISGDTFREFCDYVFDETRNTVSPENVKQGQTIFVKTDYLARFFQLVHPKIAEPYILVTHNSDDGAPGPFASYLDDPKILKWFAQNASTSHQKLHPIPIGIANRCWPHGSVSAFQELQGLIGNVERNIFVYMNFSLGTYPKERMEVFHLFKKKPFCVRRSPTNLKNYLSDLIQSKFVLSPRGNGLDCHRTWEALLMGAIPIVKSSTLDPLFENLPVLIIDNWKDVNFEFLQKKWLEMSALQYRNEKMYAGYWFALILQNQR